MQMHPESYFRLEGYDAILRGTCIPTLRTWDPGIRYGNL
jgi:hypothetical protein